ncbi:MAG: hypothetical protein WC375_01400 [Methanomassiliicoccales archaeon]|jgi:DNA-binding MarR family transcriptional regulator
MATPPIRLTVWERILLFIRSRSQNVDLDAYVLPFDLTQDGIAGGVGISRAHAAVEVRKMIAHGWISSSLSHVEGNPRRRTCYMMTAKGRTHAAMIKRSLDDRGVAIESVVIAAPSKSVQRTDLRSRLNKITEQLKNVQRQMDALESEDWGP